MHICVFYRMILVRGNYLSPWYVNLPRLPPIRFSTTSFTVRSAFMSRRQRPTFLMHDSRRMSTEEALVSSISGTDWVIRIYKRNTCFFMLSCSIVTDIQSDLINNMLSSSFSVASTFAFVQHEIVELFDVARCGNITSAVSINSSEKKINMNLSDIGTKWVCKNFSCNIIFLVFYPNFIWYTFISWIGKIFLIGNQNIVWWKRGVHYNFDKNWEIVEQFYRTVFHFIEVHHSIHHSVVFYFIQ